jgi:hypothetical protein
MVDRQATDRPPVPVGENDGYPLLGTAASFLVLTWISVVLRTYVRAFVTKSFLADDWLMVIAQVSGFNPPLSLYFHRARR